MKTLLHALAMCQSMFCFIPSPFQIWDDQARDKMLLFLPLIGLEIGAIWFGLGWLGRYLNLPVLVQAVILCAYPYLVTGFMHLDGFMDVTDAVKSWRDLERRREILKDSHVGSFSVIGCILLIVAQFALCASIVPEADLRILVLIPVVSRCCSALAVTCLPPMSTSQYADKKNPLSHKIFLTAVLAVTLAAGALWTGWTSLVLLGCLAGHGLTLHRAYRSLEGMNGDISGYALTCSELAALAVLAIM